jgi:hypothetical protein
VIVAPVSLVRRGGKSGDRSVLPGAVEISYDVIVDGAIVLVSVVMKLDVIVVL